jgi:LPS sulfotransferase NodH
MQSHIKSRRTIPFVIFATQRTGSNWLMGMLDAHPAIAAYDELLLAGASGSGYWGRTDIEFFEPYYIRHRKHDNHLARALWSFRYLNKLYAWRGDTEATGMKLMYDQLWENPWVLIYMMRHRIRVVHLVRMNLLDIILSAETARARKQFHAWEGHNVETPAVNIDPKTILSTLKTIEFRVKVAHWMLTLLPIKRFEVSYERLMVDPSLIGDIFTFLGVSIEPESSMAASKFKKLNTTRKSDLIGNYLEVERALQGTRFERFLDR